MGKTKTDKRVNKVAKKINKSLREDVFKDRFWIKQIRKTRVDGMQYYLYELRDRLEPERNSIFSKRWIWGGSQFLASDFFEELNDFIVKSDFWAIYWNDENRYDRKLDTYRK